jgi:hypothetical protein
VLAGNMAAPAAARETPLVLSLSPYLVQSTALSIKRLIFSRFYGLIIGAVVCGFMRHLLYDCNNLVQIGLRLLVEACTIFVSKVE